MSSADNSLTRETLMRQMEDSWNELLTFIGSLTPEQLTGPTDAAGWTAKDHIIHIAKWENAGIALLEGKSKRETLDIPQEIWDQDDDPVNAVIQERNRDTPMDEVMYTLKETHARMLRKLETMTEEDLQRPYNHYQPGTERTHPIIRNVMADTTGHYREHIPWMKAIIEKA